MYFNHDDVNCQDCETGELGKLTELKNEEETMSYGISITPLFFVGKHWGK
jgi:hypothetical protein